jgi:arabinofuranan 3-O-arabinosyltransferase
MLQFRRWHAIAQRTLRIVAYIASWALLLFVAGYITHDSWTGYASDDVEAGTIGHATVDFGGQWYTGKLLLRGEGRFLYERHHQWIVLQQGFPLEKEPSSLAVAQGWRLRDWRKGKWVDFRAQELLGRYLLPVGQENPIAAVNAFAEIEEEFGPARERFYKVYKNRQLQAEELMSYLLGRDDWEDQKTRAGCLLPLAAQDPLAVAALTAAGREQVWTDKAIKNAGQRRVGGQVYPPIHAFLYVPLALLDPVTAYRVGMIVPLVLALLAGWGLRKITAGRLWWPLGTLLCVWAPGFSSAQCLSHNGSLIVALLVWGYYFLQHNEDIRGGFVWGLFAYKPSWGVTYFLMLLVSRRWKAALAMGTCALAQIMLTIPVVGVHSWFEWRDIVKEANHGYGEYYNWVRHSRDMLAMARRVFNNFDNRFGERDTMLARVIGVMLLGMVLEATVRLTSLRGRMAKRWSFAGGAFLLLGFWMCVYHITYYDAMFTALPLALLLFVPAHVLTPYYFRRSHLEWDGAGPASDWKMVLPPGKFGLICCPLIVYLLPVILWDQIGVTLPEWLVEWTWYWPRHVLLGKEMPEFIAPYWFNIPFIVPSFMLLWVWAGWMWLRERPRADYEVRTKDSVTSAVASTSKSAIQDLQSVQVANSS